MVARRSGGGGLMAAQPQLRPGEALPDKALDISTSIWVRASAGSGKTTLLTRRVLRLLLEAMRQEKLKLPRILCLTYTRTAAAEMQNRIHAQLASWAANSDDALRDELAEFFGIRADKSLIKRATRLLALVLENPEHVRIMTMHAFCQMALHRFPLEAGISPQTALLEGFSLRRFEENQLRHFIAATAKNPALKEVFTAFAESQSSYSTYETLNAVLSAQNRLLAFFRAMPS